MNHGYFIGIGSNLEPERNIPRILDALVRRFQRLVISPCVHTLPVGIHSANDFINAVAFIETAEDKHHIKAFFNAVETQLGRDRNDHDKKIKDRTADIDILWEIAAGEAQLNPAAIPTEVYLHSAFITLAADLTLLPVPLPESEMESQPKPQLQTVSLQLGQQLFGHATTTIHHDATTGGVMIVEQAAYR